MNLPVRLSVCVLFASIHAKVIGRSRSNWKRQDFQSTCGYLTGDPTKSVTADTGYHCSLDSTLGLWGFCANTVANVGDCGFYARCSDSFSCTAGCGKASNVRGVSSMSCNGNGVNSVCSTNILVNGGESYTYLGCGRDQGVTLYALPSSVSATTTSSTPSTTKTSSTIPNSTTTLSTSSNLTSTSSISPNPTSTLSRVSAWTMTSGTMPTTTTVPNTPPSDASNAGQHAPVGSSTSAPINLGAVIGGALGGVALICLTVLGVVLLRKKPFRASSKAEDSHFGEPPPPWQDSEFKVAPQESKPVYHQTYKAYKPPASFELHGAGSHMEPAELDGATSYSRPKAQSARIRGPHEDLRLFLSGRS